MGKIIGTACCCLSILLMAVLMGVFIPVPYLFAGDTGQVGAVLWYLVSGMPLDRVLYSEQEIAHMADVRGLFIGGFVLLVLSLFGTYHLQKDTRLAAWIILFFSTTLGISCVFFFQSLFILFHMLFFRNDLWLLPADSMLIRTFPAEFFLAAAIWISVLTVILCLLIIRPQWLKMRSISK